MAIRRIIEPLRNKIQENKILKLTIIISSLILPIVFILNATGIINNDIFNFYSSLWIGFYSTLFLILFIEKKIIIVALIIINVGILIFALVGSLLAGIEGLLYMLIKMILPFIPDNWIGIELRP